MRSFSLWRVAVMIEPRSIIETEAFNNERVPIPRPTE
jgi:hypothetical protein